MHVITRREALTLAGAALAASAAARQAAAQIPAAEASLNLPVESGATLRILRPARFVEPDEVLFRENTARFQQQTGVQVRVDFVGWEDIRAQTAVTANTGSGPDVVLGWAEDPHIFVDKLVELTDVAEYLGKRYGGWKFLGEKFGKRNGTNNWIGIPFGGTSGPVVYRESAVREAGYSGIPTEHDKFLDLCRKLRAANKPAGFTLGNAVGDGNGYANWLVWSHGGFLVDEAGKVAINSKQTVEALKYAAELQKTFPPGTLSWSDVSNNRAYAANECFLTQNGVSLYFALKNDPATAAIAADTNHAPMPAGLVGSAPQSALTINAMLFRHSRFPNAAKAYLAFMMEREQYDPWLQKCLGYWAHPLNAYDRSAVWNSDPKLAVFKDSMNNRFWNGWKGPINQAAAAATAEYVMVQMCAAVASGQQTPEAAAREADRRARRYYRGT
ncbi:ABC transporter substrate-binding protein [Paracraurococcus ruber]|uniref:ABC transporter substrate-binding protein n=1 Tax=Paracraurococcus ruber TaxID=77675 RepID=A0ABS1CWU0_9PROT|nr:extracellular solute-binding protein [Paracraurococcus ruber]MBK1658932.1 ABC transporter substrate-binding protein [Paracraurococcus ruber]TDG32310.1 extracellular solute-binding protein [Paracraurococcus ruber]